MPGMETMHVFFFFWGGLLDMAESISGIKNGKSDLFLKKLWMWVTVRNSLCCE